MKIIIDTTIATDNITSIIASSADASFPVTNLQDDFTTNLWKAESGIVSAILTLGVSKGSAVELFNTNATSITITVGTGGDYEIESTHELESTFELESTESVTTVCLLSGTNGRLWADYTAFTGPHIIKIMLIAASVVNAGIVRAGNVEEFIDPAFGLSESSIDYSIEKELNNGADYFRKRNIVRTFDNLEMFETKANAFKFKHDIFDAVGPKPLAIRLSNTLTDQEFILFAKRVGQPTIEPKSSTHWSIKCGFKEVI